MHAIRRSGRWALSLLLAGILAVLVVPIGALAWYVRRFFFVIGPGRHDPERRAEPWRRAPSAFGQSCPDA